MAKILNRPPLRVPYANYSQNPAAVDMETGWGICPDDFHELCFHGFCPKHGSCYDCHFFGGISLRKEASNG
jgi:hypothetical protein